MKEGQPLHMLHISLSKAEGDYLIETNLPDPTHQFLWARGKTFPEALRELADDLEMLIKEYGEADTSILSEDAKALRLWVKANLMQVEEEAQ